MGVLAAGKVGREFRVTLPKEVRELLRLEEGDKLVFFTAEGWKGRVCFGKTEIGRLFAALCMHLHQSPLYVEHNATLKNVPED